MGQPLKPITRLTLSLTSEGDVYFKREVYGREDMLLDAEDLIKAKATGPNPSFAIVCELGTFILKGDLSTHLFEELFSIEGVDQLVVRKEVSNG